MRHFDQLLPHVIHVPCTKDEAWKQVKVKAMEIFANLLPLKLKVQVSEMIRPLHWELKKWLIDHSFVEPKLNVGEVEVIRFLNSECKDRIIDDKPLHSLRRFKLLHYVCWKPDGTINRIRTAENFIRYERDFLMACTYFMESQILETWPDTRKIWPLNIIVRFWMEWLKGLNQKPVIPWWEKLEGFFSNPDLRENSMIRLSSFFHLLSWNSRKNCLPLFKWNDVHDDDLRLCMKQMDKSELKKLFRSKPSCVLRAYLRWPFHNVFIEMANEMWPYITLDCFEDTLKYIISYPPGLEDCNCLKIFREFWDNCPNSYKEWIEDKDILEWVHLSENWHY
ncbi:hypothetical protein HNY73_019156 [Argiope bruennichi]|uniref:Uncharacterized protein n=1 Tax=Argiope bruennichi TaxID=94029 RepID=A0A8T0EFS7_ARGBR|nr:hypothetical protein HNY73_019156 [Argiope bruennichi]